MDWIYWLTGGRPMAFRGYRFTDVVTGKAVYAYEDYFGRAWLAEGKWSWFRVATKPGPLDDEIFPPNPDRRPA